MSQQNPFRIIRALLAVAAAAHQATSNAEISSPHFAVYCVNGDDFTALSVALQALGASTEPWGADPAAAHVTPADRAEARLAGVLELMELAGRTEAALTVAVPYGGGGGGGTYGSVAARGGAVGDRDGTRAFVSYCPECGVLHGAHSAHCFRGGAHGR